jgi:arsenate reductase
MDSVPRILFLCAGNAARSQMAEGFVRALAGDRFTAMSAGIEPVPVQPLAVRVMKERGIDISQQKSKNVSELLKIHFAYVITVCDIAKERCPVFPFAFHLLRWSVEDPSIAQGPEEERLDVFRRVRDVIETNVKQFLSAVPSETALHV